MTGFRKEGIKCVFLAQRLDNGEAPLEASFILIDQAGGDNQTVTLSWEANDLSSRFVEGIVNRNPDQSYGLLWQRERKWRAERNRHYI